MPETPKWYQSHESCVELAYWLVVDDGSLTTAREVLYFFEKPWKHEDDWERYLVARAAEEQSASTETPRRRWHYRKVGEGERLVFVKAVW